MANRVVLGQRSINQFGLFISKPGFNVLTCQPHEMLYHAAYSSIQVIASGSFSIAGPGGSYYDLAIPNYIDAPFITIQKEDDGPYGKIMYLMYLSNTLIRIVKIVDLPALTRNYNYRIYGVALG